ncbi:hypothetical protein BDQ12DRAFT_615005 [Crucibulum laeve]|uniref:C3H1-type domain-containing protein n=1 Tax=Crucibulum laeve TaxID=68775 RepID=A0A5C3LNJ2_9AGAR|nr:hypothetical protein BDQ12DRAFT_615005 [Crucibulum laeve]
MLKRSATLSSNIDAEAHPTKRKIDVNAFPWTIHDKIDPPKLHPTLAKTRELLSNYMLDVKFAKTHLLNSARCPQFPDSEWTNILSGRAVDLDQVLSSGYTISHDTHQTESFGSVKLIIGTTKPAKTVDTHGKWVIAWNQTINALLFTFPHRASKLRKYTRHINQLFSSLPEQFHDRIINYNRAVRMHTAQRHDLMLTDFQSFTDLHLLWVQNTGTANSRDNEGRRGTKTSGSSGGTAKRREACRRWNENKCRQGNCIYAHVCSKCRSSTHVTSECNSQTSK